MAVGRHTRIELFHMISQAATTLVFAYAAAWGVPQARTSIWEVAVGAVAIVLFMNVRTLRRAMAADRGEGFGDHV